ncbi:SCO family protein [Azonexus sp.]|uniref:SCO family protein n=1 Tax=Azonexus sp. TaxID=1872668 RepID=UPI0035B1D267
MNRRDFITLAAALALTACGGEAPGFRNTDLSSGQLFPRAMLYDGKGRARSFEEFRGKAVIVFFGYTSCPDICPSALRKYASLLRTLRDRDAARVQVIFISVDPERDTPERTDTFVKWFHPDFLGLSGTAEQIAEVATQFKVVYGKKEIGGGMGYVIDHSAAAYVLDPAGQLRLMLAETAPLEPIIADLQTLLTAP